jgi:hypothetical protein
MFLYSGEGREAATTLGPLERAKLNGPVTEVSITKVSNRSPLHLRTEVDPITESLCFIIFRIPNDGQSPETQ